MKSTEILLDLSDQKLGRIIKKDFEEVIVDISAKKSAIETPFPMIKRDKAVETKGAETFPTAPTAPIKMVETKAVESAVK